MTEKQKEQAACKTHQDLVELFISRGSEPFSAKKRADIVWEARQKKQFSPPVKKPERSYNIPYSD